MQLLKEMSNTFYGRSSGYDQLNPAEKFKIFEGITLINMIYNQSTSKKTNTDVQDV